MFKKALQGEFKDNLRRPSPLRIAVMMLCSSGKVPVTAAAPTGSSGYDLSDTLRISRTSVQVERPSRERERTSEFFVDSELVVLKSPLRLARCWATVSRSFEFNSNCSSRYLTTAKNTQGFDHTSMDKKRQASEQLTKDRAELDGAIEEDTPEGQSWDKAGEEVLRQRRFVFERASRASIRVEPQFPMRQKIDRQAHLHRRCITGNIREPWKEAKLAAKILIPLSAPTRQ